MYDDLFNSYKGAEELGLAEEGAGGTGAVVDAVEAVVEAEISELTVAVEENTAEVQTLVEKVEALEEAAEEVTDAVEGMESMIASGNINAISFAKQYAHAVKKANRLPGEAILIDEDRMGAESFADANTAELFARNGLESMGEKLKEFGKKAAEVVKAIFNSIINFFVGIFNKADALGRREKQLRDRLNGGAKIKDKIKLGGWNAYIDYATSGLVGKSAKNKGTTENIHAGLKTLLEEAAKVDGITVAGAKSAYDAITSSIKSDAQAYGKYNEKKQGSKDMIVAQDAGIRWQATYGTQNITNLSEAATAVRSIRVSITKAPEAKKLTSGAEVKAKADKAALGTALDTVKAKVAQLRDNKVKAKTSGNERDTLISKLGNIKSGDETKKSETDGKVAFVKAAYATTVQVVSMADRNEVNLADAMLDCVAAHLSFGTN